MDGQVARRADAELKKLMDQFVCVRIVQGYGLDLTLFQFNTDLTFAAFFMNADRTIYGRFGTESPRNGMSATTLNGFKRAMEGALEIHRNYPANKSSLAGKTGAKAKWRTPERIPAFAAKAKPADGSRNRCVHCHQAYDYGIRSLWAGRQRIADSELWTFPMPDEVGLELDPDRRATVKAVKGGSAAGKAGFKPGDRIVTFDGQPIISVADVQWVLQNAGDSGTIKAEVDRGGRKVPLRLRLSKGWRRGGTFVFRGHVIGWYLQEFIAGFMGAEVSPPAGNGTLGLKISTMMYKGGPLKKGDILVAVDGNNSLTMSEYLAYLIQKKRPGMKVMLTVIRGGRRQDVPWVLR